MSILSEIWMNNGDVYEASVGAFTASVTVLNLL